MAEAFADGEPDPLVITRETTEDDEDLVRFEATVHPAPDASIPDAGLDHRRFLIDNPDPHLHPRQHERIRVVDGEYAVAVEGDEQRLSTGETTTLPPDIPHRHWNPTSGSVRVVHEHRPGLRVDEHVETMYALAQAGRTNEQGIPNLLQFAVINDEFRGLVYSADLPVGLQKVTNRVLAPIGRLDSLPGSLGRRGPDLVESSGRPVTCL